METNRKRRRNKEREAAALTKGRGERGRRLVLEPANQSCVYTRTERSCVSSMNGGFLQKKEELLDKVNVQCPNEAGSLL